MLTNRLTGLSAREKLISPEDKIGSFYLDPRFQIFQAQNGKYPNFNCAKAKMRLNLGPRYLKFQSQEVKIPGIRMSQGQNGKILPGFKFQTFQSHQETFCRCKVSNPQTPANN